MRTKNSSLDWTWAALGLVFFLFFHLFSINEIPGLHFDEAWAMNFAHRIANEPGFWPLKAMSPYTAPWAHYWAALWLKIHPSLLSFRLSQMALSCMGIFFLSYALWPIKRKAALLFPLIVSLLPGLVLNHRFAIELNGFHVAMFGLCAFALQRKWVLLFFVCFLLACTAHILFYGFGLAFFAVLIWERKEISALERWAGIISALLLTAFFYSVYLGVPEKNKALALVLSSLSVVFLLLFKAESWKLSWPETILGLFAFVFFANALFFLEGSWNLAIQTGRIFWHSWGLLGILSFIPLAIYLFWQGIKNSPRWWFRFFLLSLMIVGVMMLKPAPRYFEVLFLIFAVFLTMGFESLKILPRFAILLALALHAIPVYCTYFSSQPREEELRLLLWKDSSRDFLSKQSLVFVLGSSGCRLSDIKNVDSRIKESLLALSWKDWPVANKPCPYTSISRRMERENGRREGEFYLE